MLTEHLGCLRAFVSTPTLAALCCRAWRSTTSVHTACPVRSAVSRTLFREKVLMALRAIWSHSSRSTGCPAAATKNQLAIRRCRASPAAAAEVGLLTSVSQPTSSVSAGWMMLSSGCLHSASMSAYAPPSRSTTMYLQDTLRVGQECDVWTDQCVVHTCRWTQRQ